MRELAKILEALALCMLAIGLEVNEPDLPENKRKDKAREHFDQAKRVLEKVREIPYFPQTKIIAALAWGNLRTCIRTQLKSPGSLLDTVEKRGDSVVTDLLTGQTLKEYLVDVNSAECESDPRLHPAEKLGINTSDLETDGDSDSYKAPYGERGSGVVDSSSPNEVDRIIAILRNQISLIESKITYTESSPKRPSMVGRLSQALFPSDRSKKKFLNTAASARDSLSFGARGRAANTPGPLNVPAAVFGSIGTALEAGEVNNASILGDSAGYKKT